MKNIIVLSSLFFLSSILCNSQNFTIKQSVTGQNNLTDIRGQSFIPSVQGTGSGEAGINDTVYFLKMSIIYAFSSVTEADTMYLYSATPDSTYKLDSLSGGILIGKSYLKEDGDFPYTDYYFQNIPIHKNSTSYCLFHEDVNLEASAGSSYSGGSAYRNIADTLNYNSYLDLKFIATIFSKPIDTIKAYIPDPNFRVFLNTNYPNCLDYSGDSLIIDSASAVTGYFICDSSEISDLTGLEYFTGITSLMCSYNNLTTLPDLSAIKDLSWITCTSNQITSLPDLSANTELYVLCCPFNFLTSLPDLSANINLTRIYCHKNKITSLPDLSSNTSLYWVDCSSNELTSLPDFSNTNLQQLYCDNNKLTGLPDFSTSTSLIYLSCSDNILTSLPDLSSNNSLTNVVFSANYLDFSDAAMLRSIDTISNLTHFSYIAQHPFGKGDSINLCIGDTLVLSINSQDSAISYQWFKDEMAINGATDTLLTINSVTSAQKGIYTCKSYGNALKSPPMTWGPGITEFVSKPFVVSIPQKAIFYGLEAEYCFDDTLTNLTGIPSGGAFDGPGIYDTIFNPDDAGIGNHSIIYSVTDTNGCLLSDMQYVIVQQCVNDIGSVENHVFSIFPNPVDQFIYIEGANYSKMKLYNSKGMLMMLSGERMLDLSNLSAGQYFIKLISDDGVFQMEKFIIAH